MAIPHVTEHRCPTCRDELYHNPTRDVLTCEDCDFEMAREEYGREYGNEF